MKLKVHYKGWEIHNWVSTNSVDLDAAWKAALPAFALHLVTVHGVGTSLQRLGAPPSRRHRGHEGRCKITNLLPIAMMMMVSVMPAYAEDTPATAADSSVVKSDKLKTFPEIPGITDPFQKLLYNSVRISLERDEAMLKIDSSLAKFRQDAEKKDKPSAEFLVAYKQDNSTVEGSKVLLEEDLEIRSLCSGEFLWEKTIDQRYLSMVLNFSQLAATMNAADYESNPKFQSAKAELVSLIGDADAASMLNGLAALKGNTNSDAMTAMQDKVPFWPEDFNRKVDSLEQATQKIDPVMQELVQQVDKKTQPDKSLARHRMVSNGLNILSFMPGGIGDLANVAQMAYDATGGAEDARLLHSVYLYKRVEIRKRIISSACRLAVHNYEAAVESKNPFLFAFANSLIDDLGGPGSANQIAADSNQ